jgi:hypothetical protein
MEGAERRHDPDTLHTIDTRLTMVESELERIANQRKWLVSLFGMFLLQFCAFIYGYAQLTLTVENINLSSYEANINTALAVLASHGNEIETVRSEQQRIRGAIDQLYLFNENTRNKLDTQTRDRWYREDGLRLEKRIDRLESIVVKPAIADYP